MSMQSWVQCVQTAQVAGGAVSSGGPTTILPTSALFTFPANFFNYIGQKFRVKAFGSLTTSATGNNLTLSFYLGSVIVATTTAIALGTAAATYAWELEITGTIRALGSGTSSNNAYYGHIICSTGVALSPYVFPLSFAVSAGWDCTAALQADLRATLSATGDSITLQDYSLEAMN
jgi:hypothetical protein